MAEMGQFRLQNWNRHIFQLDGVGIGIELTTNFSGGIGIGTGDLLLCWNRNQNLTTVSGIGIGIVPSLVDHIVTCQAHPPLGHF